MREEKFNTDLCVEVTKPTNHNNDFNKIKMRVNIQWFRAKELTVKQLIVGTGMVLKTSR